MALLINRDIQLENGITINNAYVRIEVTNTFDGKNLKVSTKKFISEDSYKEGKSEITISEIPAKVYYNYDRLLEGDNILELAHTKLIQEITTPVSKTTYTLDPSSGEKVVDEVTYESWVQDASISIIDISIG